MEIPALPGAQHGSYRFGPPSLGSLMFLTKLPLSPVQRVGCTMCVDVGWGHTQFSRDRDGKEQLQGKIKLGLTPADQ